MKKFGEFVCKNKITILIITGICLLLSLVGIYKTKINYDILVYLPKDIETVIGENILTEDFNMGSFSIITTNDMSPKEILSLEEEIKNIIWNEIKEKINKTLPRYKYIKHMILTKEPLIKTSTNKTKRNEELAKVTKLDLQ